MIQKINLKLYGNQSEMRGTCSLMSINYLTRRPDNNCPYKSKKNLEPHEREMFKSRIDLKSNLSELKILTRLRTKLVDCKVAL